MAIAEKLLHEATTALLHHRYHFQHPRSGLFHRPHNDISVGESMAQVDVNHASTSELAALPVIGPVLADRIIETRRSQGYFTSLSDVAEKVSGLGLNGATQLANVLNVDEQGRPLRPMVQGEFAKDFKALLTYTNHKRSAPSLTMALEEIAVFAAHNPHPATRLAIKRGDLEPLPTADSSEQKQSIDAIHVLADQEYYSTLADLLQKAQRTIDVCMFFIGLGADTHPTYKLLDILTRKAAAGSQVRVLLDRDDQDDPYGSRLINAKAARFLAEHGVQVKFDRPELLLHSKFVLIDDAWTVVGSHNWTIGSFFEYRDLSLALNGVGITKTWKERFETLWAEGLPID
ncbi:MAG: phospholipase D-like domain-containing protein [Cyanobacteria bacterium J06638_22]